MKIKPFILFIVPLVAGHGFASETAEPDQSIYHLFNPVPDQLLRDFDSDRPDKTNSPHTLDAGRFQVESGLFAYTLSRDAGVRTEHWTWLDTALRCGLNPWAELQLVVPSYQLNRDTDLTTRETDSRSGIGDLTVILKTNFWGNDKGDSAGGMQFLLKAPTASHGLGNGEVEGGVFFLLGMKLPADFSLGINNGVGISANDEGRHNADIINSISVSHEIVGPLSAYVEFYSSVPTQHSADWEGTVDLGLLLMIGKNLQFDAGINLGVTHAADDVQPFLGMSYRF